VTFPEPDPLHLVLIPHLDVISAQALAYAAVCPLRLGRADLHRARVHRDLPCRPRPSAPAAWALAVRLGLRRRQRRVRHWPEALTAGEACGGRGTTGVFGLRPACGCRCSPRLTAILEMLHPRCRRGPTRCHEVVTDGDARRWHQPAFVVSGGSGRRSREEQWREGAREWCCGVVRTREPSPHSSLMTLHIR
jgi:hypothetical protein